MSSFIAILCFINLFLLKGHASFEISAATVLHLVNNETNISVDGLSLDCQNGNNCDIICDEFLSCRDTTINCPNSMKCNIFCLANDHCESMTVNGPNVI